MRVLGSWLPAAAFAAIIAGTAFSHLIAPNVRVEKLTLVGDTPALRLSPSSPGPHPVALLGHGATGSKESLFRFGEALANAGFECFIIDFPGHGESHGVVSIQEIGLKPAQVARSLGPVDVYLGHSMGAGAGAMSVRDAGFSPRLFIALGANPQLGERGPPLLLLAGRFDEFHRPAALVARTDARVVVSPWSDHVLELWDPILVNAAVAAACETVGKSPPVPQTAWIWRLLGHAAAMAGALVLVLVLPESPSRFPQLRGLLVPVILIAAQALTLGTWFKWIPDLQRLPLQLALAILVWLALRVLEKLRLPRWSLLALTAAVASACAILTGWIKDSGKLPNLAFPFRFLMLITALTTVLLLVGMVVGTLAARRGTRKDASLAMAVFAGYAIGQWMPKFM